MKLPSQTIPALDATSQGYRPMTQEYFLPSEREALDNVMRDLDRGNIDYVLVGDQKTPEVWRKGMKVIRGGEHT